MVRTVFSVFALFVFSFSLFSSPASARWQLNPYFPEEIIPGFDFKLRKEGIGTDYSPESMEKLIQSLSQLQQETQNLLARESFQDFSKGWLERREKFLGTYLDNQKREDLQDRSGEFFLGKHLLYMIRTDEKLESEEKRQVRHIETSFDEIVRIGRRLLKKRRFLHVDRSDLDRPVGAAKVRDEARNLVDPTQPDRILAEEELVHLTPRQIGALDVGDHHPMWHSEAYLKNHPDIWRRNEDWIGKSMTRYLNEKHEINKEFPDFSYDLLKSQKVLFFDDIRLSGTSAKIDVKDSFHQDWKIKWSDEIHAEAICNRLYLALGARFTDPVYALQVGKAGTTLILKDPKKRPDILPSKKSCYVTTAEELIKCLIRSHFQYNIRSYIHSTGEITQDNLDEILELLPPEALKEYRPQELIGRHFVTFKEGLLEFVSKKVIHRGGPISMTRFGTERDRVIRGLLLFNAWIHNNDMKEDNNKMYLLPNFPWASRRDQGQKYNLVWAQHDMGVSLKGIIGSANPNHFSSTRIIQKTERSLLFNYFLLSLPGAYRDTSYADLLWMGRKIVGLTRPQIEEIVSSSHWPDFQQQAMVYKLLSRRNKIAEALELTSLLSPEERTLTAPSLSIPMGTLEERKAAAQKYGVPAEALEQLYRNGRRREPDFADRVLINGRVALCESTLMIRLLHWHRHPTGLERRLPRYRIFHKLRLRKNCGGVPKVDYF